VPAEPAEQAAGREAIAAQEAFVIAAYNRADALWADYDSLAAAADRAEEAADQAEAAAGLAGDLAETADDEAKSAEEEYASYTQDLTTAKMDRQTAETELNNLILEQNRLTSSRYQSTGLKYYSWSGADGNQGSQLVAPLEYGYWRKDFSYGLSADLIYARGTSASYTNASGITYPGGSGSYGGFSDLTVFAEKRKETEKYLYQYGLELRLPTGSPTQGWSTRYASMPEDLVEFGQFGQGWQVTPRFDLTKRLNKEDTLTLGTSYSFKGSYDLTREIPGDTISPGGEWLQRLRYQHAGAEWQLVGELIHTNSSTTELSDGRSYTNGSGWEQRLTYNRVLNENEDLMFYYWRQSTASESILPTDVKSAPVNYFGTMWSRKLDEKRTFRLGFDIMKSNGSHYSHMANSFNSGRPEYSSVSVDGRTKYTLGAIYDYKIDNNSRFIAELQAFNMKDGPSTSGKPAMSYRGVNFFVTYNKSF
jgi:hypothetical protein